MQVLSCTPVPASVTGDNAGQDTDQPQVSRAAPTNQLAEVVSWCHQQMVQQHLLAELQVLPLTAMFVHGCIQLQQQQYHKAYGI